MANIHISQHEKGWQVKLEGNERATSVHSTQAEAIVRGREIAIANESELFIHGKDGKIRERNSYGNDPKNRKG